MERYLRMDGRELQDWLIGEACLLGDGVAIVEGWVPAWLQPACRYGA